MLLKSGEERTKFDVKDVRVTFEKMKEKVVEKKVVGLLIK